MEGYIFLKWGWNKFIYVILSLFMMTNSVLTVRALIVWTRKEFPMMCACLLCSMSCQPLSEILQENPTSERAWPANNMGWF